MIWLGHTAIGFMQQNKTRNVILLMLNNNQFVIQPWYVNKLKFIACLSGFRIVPIEMMDTIYWLGASVFFPYPANK
jgi:hypothetical protein